MKRALHSTGSKMLDVSNWSRMAWGKVNCKYQHQISRRINTILPKQPAATIRIYEILVYFFSATVLHSMQVFPGCNNGHLLSTLEQPDVLMAFCHSNMGSTAPFDGCFLFLNTHCPSFHSSLGVAHFYPHLMRMRLSIIDLMCEHVRSCVVRSNYRTAYEKDMRYGWNSLSAEGRGDKIKRPKAPPTISRGPKATDLPDLYMYF